MRRLLAVIDSFGLGGAETQLAQVLTLLAESRQYSCLACSILPQLRVEAEIGAGVDRVYLEKRSRFSVPRVTARLVDVVRHFKPDIVYSRLPLANGLARVASFVVGGSQHVAGIDTMPEMYTALYTIRHPGSLLFRWLERHADRIVCNSAATANAIIAQGYSSSRVRVVRNGIDIEHFRPSETRSRSSVARLVCVASLRPEKGVGRLLTVLAPLLKNGHNELTIVGDGVERVLLERLVQTSKLHNVVRFAGAMKDVRPALNDADVFVSAATVEGFGIAVAEAAATGLPTVAFAAPGGLPEVVIDGVTGFLVPPDSPEIFRQRVEQLCGDSSYRQSIGNAARKHIASHFSLGAVVEELDQTFSELANR